MDSSDWIMKSFPEYFPSLPWENIQDYKSGNPAAIAIQNETTPKHLALIMWLPVNYSSN